MTSVKQLLGIKGSHVWTLEPDATVYEALTIMAKENVGALVVVEGRRVVGIFSERDYARKVILAERSSKETRIREVMTSRVLCVGLEQTTQECMALMTQQRGRHLPVLEDGRLVGLISIGDVVKSIISEQAFMIERLEDYIMGG